jgi:putative endonuclease
LPSIATASSSRSTLRPDPTAAASGPRAEALAAQYLMRQGLTIVARNFRTRFGEIDLIAKDGSTLVFVEVRMRSSTSFGGALESITAQKRARMIAAARGYLAMIGGEPACRFDAILMQRLDAACIDWRRDIVDVE